MSETVSETIKLMVWLLGAVFTVCLLVVGFFVSAQNRRLDTAEDEIRRVAQMQAMRGERITVVEGQVKSLELRQQQLSVDISVMRQALVYRSLPPSEKFPENQ